jgi:hypothetical protein
MSKRKKTKPDTKLVRKPYQDIIEKHPEFKGVIAEKSWDYIGHSDKGTVSFLRELWTRNIRKNKMLWRKHASIAKDCVGLGVNKATICIGGGQSFNKNKVELKRLVDADGIKPWKDRDFIIIASNHMYKPLLNMGIIPDFVGLADGSDVVMDQLNGDIPKSGQNTVLLCGMQCSPRVLKEWHKQGRAIRFYLPHTPGLDDVFRNEVGRDPAPHIILQGGNVLNSMWSIALKFFHSTVFFAVGNDLSYSIQSDIEDQRKGYYADGDYSSNVATKRDEAKGEKKWLGYTQTPALVVAPGRDRYITRLDIVGTSPTLWVYKTWLEANVMGNAFSGIAKYHYYNCTEGGIAGVMCSDMDDDTLNDEKNWFLLDEKCPRWHTMPLADAAHEFKRAKEMMTWGLECDAPLAGVLDQTKTQAFANAA